MICVGKTETKIIPIKYIEKYDVMYELLKRYENTVE
jgi:hypothetical protein